MPHYYLDYILTTFEKLELIEPLRRALAAQNYESPTPIQVQSIPLLLQGRDVIGCAQTGTGKTAAFALPVLQHIANNPIAGPTKIRALVLSPTRELAAQIAESFESYSAFLPNIRHMVMFGGVKENPQISNLKRGVDVLIATPGRLLDLQNRGFVDLKHVEFFVLDEADRMLDMGFVNDVKRILKVLPKTRQNLLFSATMPPAVSTLAATFITNPARVEVTPQATTVEAIDQRVMFVDKNNKGRLLVELLGSMEIDRAIVFTRTKHGANRLCQQLEKSGYTAVAIHGNKSQNARNKALETFKSGETRVLVATDIASRGIDIDDVTHVFNYDLPNEPESYVHRIGRTGRAGRDGHAVSFCEEEETAYLRDIEKTIGMNLPVHKDQPFHSSVALAAVSSPKRPPAPQRQQRPPRGNRGPATASATPNKGGQRARQNARSNSAKPVANSGAKSGAKSGDSSSAGPRRQRNNDR